MNVYLSLLFQKTSSGSKRWDWSPPPMRLLLSHSAYLINTFFILVSASNLPYASLIVFSLATSTFHFFQQKGKTETLHRQLGWVHVKRSVCLWMKVLGKCFYILTIQLYLLTEGLCLPWESAVADFRASRNLRADRKRDDGNQSLRHGE